MNRLGKGAFVLFGAAGLALGTFAPNSLGDGQADAGPVEAAVQLPQVPVAEVVVRPYTKTHMAIGHLEARQTVDVTPRIAGLITEAHVPEGGAVRKGDLLFLIDSVPYEIQVTIAAAQLERARALADQAEADRIRAVSLADKGAASRKALEDATALKRSRDAEVLVAQAAVDDAEMRLGYTEIRAPIDGIIDRIAVQPGNQVLAGPQTLLTRIVSTEKLYVALHLDEATYLNLPQPSGDGIPVTVELAAKPGTRLQGRLDFMATEFDTRTATLEARAVVDNPDGQLKPGHFVRVEIPTAPQTDSVFVAETSIGTAMGGRYVLVVDAAGTVGMRPVTLGDAMGQLRVIETGLNAGDRVVLKGLVGPGMTVSPLPSEMPGADKVPQQSVNAGEM